MRINKHNLTIVTHCADKPIKGQATDGLEFTSTGTRVISDGAYYSISVTALSVDNKEPLGVLGRADAEALTEGEISLAKLPFVKERSPKILNNLNKPPVFDLTIDANLLLKIAQSALEFDQKGVIRVQFVGKADPVRMDSRNTETGQRWEVLLMPRLPGVDAARFAEPQPGYIPATPEQAHCVPAPLLVNEIPAPPPLVNAIPIPPPPSAVEEDPFAAALAAAMKLAGQ